MATTYNPQQTGSGISLQNSPNRIQTTYNPQSNVNGINIQPAVQPRGISISQPGTSQSILNNLTPGMDPNLQRSIDALNASIRANQQVYAPALDLASINSQARAKAEANVNPYYVKQLNTFIQRQTFNRGVQQKQTQMNIDSLNENLKNTLQQGEIDKTRTSQDVASNLNQINTKADEFQQDTGQEFNDARIAQAKQLASQGLTGSGIGTQQQLATQSKRNTVEGRQSAEFKQQKDVQNLFKTRTFEDIARSGGLATKAKEKGQKQAEFDLNNYIKNQEFELESEKLSLESQRLQRVAQETSAQGGMLVNQFIQSIANPAQRQAAAQAYGGLF